MSNSLLQACGSGQRGSTRLREAIDAYEPRRKYANGHLEEDFLDLCERRGLPLPLLNPYVHDIKVRRLLAGTAAGGRAR